MIIEGDSMNDKNYKGYNLNTIDKPENMEEIIGDMLKEELDGGEKTGFDPYINGREIYFWQRGLLIIGEKN
jgi:hypothetical protein